MIRSMSSADCNQVAMIEAQEFGTILDQHRLLALLKSPVFFGFVDDLKGTNAVFDCPTILISYLLANIIVDEAEILSIAVLADYQNLGRGNELLKHFNAFVAAKNVKTVFLEVAADNKAALTLYRSQGFSECSRRLAYYKRVDSRCDAIKMKLHVKEAFP
ncbi:GNAT family N-acetyltransferase [Candidatus Puniceispirillum sp.]|nr:GNAT family N-acetyltransferase [Candidatus Puniceispirillum sp.]